VHRVRWLPGVLLVAALVGCGSDQPSESEANEIINNQLDELVASSHGFFEPSGVDATCVRSEDSERTYECNGALTFKGKGKGKGKGNKGSTEVSSPIEFVATVGEDSAVISRCRGEVVYGENRCAYIGVTGGSAAGPPGG
jgi:hypothetical protein